MAEKDSVRVVEYHGIGMVNFVRKPLAKHLKITIKTSSLILVNVPANVSFTAAGNFVAEKQQWIRKCQARLARFKRNVTVYQEQTSYKTLDYKLVLGRHEKSSIQTVIRDGWIRVMYPLHADVTDPRIQQAIRKAFLAAWRLEAAKYLPELVRSLALHHQFSYKALTFRNNKTRWGSCSRDNRINLNIHLIRLPDYLCAYVILHELCHTVHKHHQKAFWQLLDRVTGGKAKALDKELNAYSPEVW